MFYFTSSRFFLSRTTQLLRAGVQRYSLKSIDTFKDSTEVEKVRFVANFLFERLSRQGKFSDRELISLRKGQKTLEGNNAIHPELLSSTVTVPLFDQQPDEFINTPEAVAHAANTLYDMLPFTSGSEKIEDRACVKYLLEETGLLADDDLVVVQGTTNSQTALDSYVSARKKGLQGVTVVGLDLSSHCLRYGIATTEALGISHDQVQAFQGDALAQRDWKRLYPNTRQTKFLSLLGPVLSKGENMAALQRTREMMREEDRLVVGTYIADDASQHYNEVISFKDQKVVDLEDFVECYTKISNTGIRILNQCFAKTPQSFEALLKKEGFKVENHVQSQGGYRTARMFVAKLR